MILLSNIKIEGCQQSPVSLQQQMKYVSNQKRKIITLLLIQMCLCERQQLKLQLHMSGHMCMYV